MFLYSLLKAKTAILKREILCMHRAHMSFEVFMSKREETNLACIKIIRLQTGTYGFDLSL